MLAGFGAVAAGLTYHEPVIPVVSGLTGQPAGPGELTDPGYWVRHVREAVRFGDVALALHRQGVRDYLELGPDGVLSAMAATALADQPGDPAGFVPVLRPDHPERRTLLAALARWHVRGGPVRWADVLGGPRPRIELPTYAFQRERYWPDLTAARTVTPSGSAEIDARFWAAVEQEDLAALAAAVDDDGSGPDQSGLDALRPALPVLSSYRRRQRAQSALDAWRYRLTWAPSRLSPSASLTGTWLLVIPDEPAGSGLPADLLAKSLETSGVTVVRATLDTTDPDRARFTDRLRATLDRASAVGGAASISADHATRARRAVGEAVAATSAGADGPAVVDAVAADTAPETGTGVADAPGAGLVVDGVLAGSRRPAASRPARCSGGPGRHRRAGSGPG